MQAPDEYGKPNQAAIDAYRRIFEGYSVELTSIGDLLDESAQSTRQPRTRRPAQSTPDEAGTATDDHS
ncbi:hypothetical protein HQ32_04100 [Prauserella sp. Am3]|nr:hypothetical protein HQ32_04100 [Prauserella sp. Am3]